MSDLKIFGQSLPELFDRFRSDYFPWKDIVLYPPIDIEETSSELIIKAEVPGVDKDNLEIYLGENAVVLKRTTSEAKETIDKGFRRLERRSGAFERTITYPVSVLADKAQANLKNGLLEIRIPKDETKIPQLKRLSIDNDQKDFTQ